MIDKVIEVLKTDTKYWHSRVFKGWAKQSSKLPVLAVSGELPTRDWGMGDGTGLNILEYHPVVRCWTKDRVEDIQKHIIDLMYTNFHSLLESSVIEREEETFILILQFKILGGK